MKEIKIYSTTWCGYCHMLKEYLKSKGIAYKDVDVEQDANAAMYIQTKTGQMGVPVSEIDGEFIVGFDRPKIDAILGIK